MAARKLLMLVGDYAEDYETMAPFQPLQMAGQPGLRTRLGWPGFSPISAPGPRREE